MRVKVLPIASGVILALAVGALLALPKQFGTPALGSAGSLSIELPQGTSIVHPPSPPPAGHARVPRRTSVSSP